MPRIEAAVEDYQVLGWENQDSQFKRFSVLNSIVEKGMSLLDVGCGLGNLLDYFELYNHHIDYTGVDIMKRMVDMALKKRPSGNFHVADIFNEDIFSDKKFSIVYSSGIFNIDLGNNEDFLLRALKKFDELSSSFIVFNLLHKRSTDKEYGYFYCDPDKTRALILDYFPEFRVKIADDYLTNDFTVIIFK